MSAACCRALEVALADGFREREAGSTCTSTSLGREAAEVSESEDVSEADDVSDSESTCDESVSVCDDDSAEAEPVVEASSLASARRAPRGRQRAARCRAARCAAVACAIFTAVSVRRALVELPSLHDLLADVSTARERRLSRMPYLREKRRWLKT